MKPNSGAQEGVRQMQGAWAAQWQEVPKASRRLGGRLSSQHERWGNFLAADFHWQMCRFAWKVINYLPFNHLF